MRYWQTNRYFLRSLKIVAWIVATFVVFFYLLPLLLFRIPAVQRTAAGKTADLLTQVFDTPVELKRVDLTGWTDLEVHQVLVRDSLHRPMLVADRLVGGLSLLDLLWDQELRITSARLFKAQLTLIRDPKTGRLNIQHTIDHLSKPSSSKKSLPVDINSIIIRDMRLSLLEPGRKPISLTQLSTRIRRLRFAPKYIGGAIDELSFDSSFGLRLSSLTAQVELMEQQLTLSNLQLALPSSSISLPLTKLNLKGKGLELIQELEVGASDIAPQDLAFLHPALGKMQVPLHLQASYCREGAHDAQLELSLRQPERLFVEGQARVVWDGLGKVKQLKVPALEVALRSTLLSELQSALPASLTSVISELQRSSKIAYQGQADYVPATGITSQGKLSMDQGRWDYELRASLEGHRLSGVQGRLLTRDFDVSPWIAASHLPLGHLSSQLDLDLKNATGLLEDWQGTASLQLPWVEYDGARLSNLSARISPIGAKRHQLELEVGDPGLMLQARAQTSLSAKGLTDMALEVQLRHLDGAQWRFVPQLGSQRLALGARLRLSSFDIDRGQGELVLDHASLESVDRSLNLENLTLRFSGSPETGRILSLRSPYVTTQLSGHFTIAQLLPDLKKTLYHHYPSLAPATMTKEQGQSRSDWELALQLHRLPESWQQVLHLPLGLEQGVDLRANYIGSAHALHLEADAPSLRLQGNRLHAAQLAFSDGELQVRGDLQLASGTEVRGISLQAHTSLDSIHAEIGLGRDSLERANGYLRLGARLSPYFTETGHRKGVGVVLNLSPSEIRILNDRWQIAPAQVSYAGGALHVQGLDLASAERRVSVSGALTPRPEDHLNVALKKINLRYILSAIGVGFDLVDTELTGQGQARLLAGKVLASAAVTSPSLFVKGVDAGHLQADLSFDSGDGRILLSAKVDQPQGGHADVSGYIRPANGAGIDLHFDADTLQAGFVAPFMDTLFDRVDGRATGQVRLFGVFEEGVTIEGDADVTDGIIGVRLLGTSYRFSRRLSFTPTSIRFDKIPVMDDEGHQGVLDGVIRHRFFDQFDLDITASELRGMKVLETTTKQSLPFFGKAYGSGTAKLKGKLPKLLFDVDLRSDAGTNLTLDFNATGVRKEERLFSFKSLRDEQPDSLVTTISSSTEVRKDAETELTMHLALRVTPDARLALRLGSQTIPNEVTARCEGNLTIDVPHFGAPTTYGTLSLREGTYIFNFEELTRKRFTLLEGGRLDFRGDPLAALIDLRAVHALTANIADLDAGLSTLAQRTTMPVNCLIHLGGVISKPDITLGIELSGAEPELERRVQSLLSTEDERNRQFLYLMALGKFYTPENRRNTVAVSNSLTSFAASTLSDQLNRVLGSFSRSVQLGTNFRTNNTAFEDTDIELLFSSSWLGDRLLINGNVGYHDNPFLSGKYIGEFDLEYKLNASGTLRLKGYSHYNNMYQYLRQSLTTQGLGFMFQRRFDSLQELFTPQRKRKKSTFATENSHH